MLPTIGIFSGSISGTGSIGTYDGVYLTHDGAVTNAANAEIIGYFHGVHFSGSDVTVVDAWRVAWIGSGHVLATRGRRNADAGDRPQGRAVARFHRTGRGGMRGSHARRELVC